MAQIKRILFECTRTFENDINTGIQRVIRNIVKESVKTAKDFDWEIVPVRVKYGSFLRVEPGEKSCLAVPRTAGVSRLKRIYGKFRPLVMKISPSGLMEKMIFTLVHHVKIFLSAIFSFPDFVKEYYSKRVIPCNTDMVLLLDSSWVYPIWPAARYAKKRGATVGLLVYDLIPIQYRQFFPDAISEMFKKWFESGIKIVDFVVTISQTVKNEIQKYLETNHPENPLSKKIDFFILGSTLDNQSVNQNIRREVIELFDKNNEARPYLTVGIIDLRKNHKYLLEVFERVYKDFPSARLCIAGRVGWQCEDFVQKFKSHPLYGKSLYMFNDLSDAELDYCYSHAKSLIFPSHAEGFGLPIVESLFKGLPVLASDIPIFREVGKNFCTYFDQTNPESLADIICKIEKDGKMPPVCQPEQYHLASWADSCRELLTKSLELSRN